MDNQGLEIGKVFVEAIIRQSEYLSSLSITTMGGLVVLIVWLTARAAQEDKKVYLRLVELLPLAAVFHAASVLLYYATVGVLIPLVPKILTIKTESDASFASSLPTGEGWLRVVEILQFACFAVGIVCVGVFALANMSLLKDSVRKNS